MFSPSILLKQNYCLLIFIFANEMITPIVLDVINSSVAACIDFVVVLLVDAATVIVSSSVDNTIVDSIGMYYYHEYLHKSI